MSREALGRKPSRVVFELQKPDQFYEGIRIAADTGLHEQIAAHLAPYLSKGARVLDFGCGQGALSQRLADLGATVLSVDVDEGQFRASTEFQQLDFNNDEAVKAFIDEHAATFDIVLGVEVIEHVENPWKYVRDLKRLAKVGGLILVSTPNVSSWYSRTTFLFTGRFHQFQDSDRAYGHINPIAEDELRLIAENSGLDVLSVSPGGWLPRLWLGGGYRQVLMNMLGFLASFVMRGIWDGWCLIVMMRKSRP